MKKHPMPPDTAADVIERDNHACAVCGLPVQGKGHIHHRRPRGMGGAGSGEVHVLSNLLYLHPSCHLQHVEQQRERAYENGWLVHMWEEPDAVPLMYKLNGWAFLTDDGHIVIREETKNG